MTTGSGPPEQTVSDVVAARIRESRLRRGWTAAQLAEACARRGADKLTTSVINNIETGRRDAQGRRRRELSIDELLVLALVLDVAPIQLMGLPAAEGEAVVRIAPTCSVSGPQALLLWIRGDRALPENDDRRYYSSVIESSSISRHPTRPRAARNSRARSFRNRRRS
jgi:transcriptional regulator with XRE-family HTH domain